MSLIYKILSIFQSPKANFEISTKHRRNKALPYLWLSFAIEVQENLWLEIMDLLKRTRNM